MAGLKYLVASKNELSGELTFSAFSTPGAFGLGPVTRYSAEYVHERHGLRVFAITSVVDDEGAFSLKPVDGTPTEATLEPPAPFSGSGAFKLESPTTASWTGDLTVEIPTLGRVDLAEPGFWAGACEAARCTKTFPPGRQVLFGASFE